MKYSKYSLAIGLRYDRESRTEAPRLTLNTENCEADVVVRIAQRLGVPVVHDGALATALQNLDLDHSVPPELYRAVAILFCHLERD